MYIDIYIYIERERDAHCICCIVLGHDMHYIIV